MFRHVPLTVPTTLALLLTGTARADIVVNEVLGSTTGEDTEYVELHNRGTDPIDIGGWRIELWDSDAGSGFGRADGGSPYTVPAGTTIASGGHFLLANELTRSTFGVAADVSLPADAIENGSYTIVLSDATGMRVDTIFVTDGDTDDAANIAGDAITADLSIGPNGAFLPAGFTREPDGGGTLALLEFSPVPAPSGTPTGNAAPPPPGGTTEATIMEIQGRAHVSPLLGETVRTSGVVTAVAENGFYLQDSAGDEDAATSDALFVFTRSAPDVAPGDALRLVAEVAEFTPGGASSRNLSTTQLSSPTIEESTAGAALPAPVVLGAAERVPPPENIDDDAFASFDPGEDGIDFFESLEAMRVTVASPLAIAPTNRFGEIFTVVDAGAAASGISTRQTLNISPTDFNPEKVQIDLDENILPGFELPLVDVGSTLGDVTGVLSYGFGNFEVLPTEPFDAGTSAILAETTTLGDDPERLTIASYNVLNLDTNDDDGDADVANGRFEAIAAHIVDNLGAPDIVGLQEVQDDDGSTDSDVTTAAGTLQALVDAIATAGGPTYAFEDTVDLVPNSVGGQPGGNIRVAFLYDPERVEPAGDAMPLVDPAEQATDASNPFFGSRISLAADFVFAGRTVTLVNNHLSSKGGSAPILGLEQPFDERQEDPTVNGSLDERQAQATAVAAFVDDILSTSEDARVVVLGDLNEFEFVSPVADILGARLSNTTEALDPDERYSFVFQGNSQQLDHVLLSDSLRGGAEVDVVHVNAEFVEDERRASDHDPVLVSLIVGEAERPSDDAADLNADGAVDRADYLRFLRSFEAGKVASELDERADYDGDGRVDRRDLRTFVERYGEYLRANGLLGDIDRDGRVGLRDALRLLRALGSRAGRADYDPDADLNADGRVNGRDIRRFLGLSKG